MKDKRRESHLRDERDDVILSLEAEIEELRSLQRKAEDSQRNYFELFNLAPFAYFTLNRRGIILEANDAAVKLLGQKNKRRLLAERFGNYVVKADQERWSECRDKVFQQGCRVSCDMTISTNDGTLVLIRAEGMPEENLERPPQKMWLAVSDITVWKKAEAVLERDKDALDHLVQEKTFRLLESEQKLLKSERLSDIGTLAATIAHELRNPLAAIKMAAYNIKRKGRVASNGSLETIEKKIAESEQIITNLLFYSRLKQPQIEKIEIAPVVENTLELAMATVGQKHVKVRKELAGLQHVCISGDSLQLQEVFHNIINNAIDAVKEKSGIITVGGGVKGTVVEIWVKDNGSGMDAEAIQNVFKPFFTTKSRGTGLGLTVSKQIVDMHQGHIFIKSEKDKGTKVTVRFLKVDRS